jgi:hypothetical protein
MFRDNNMKLTFDDVVLISFGFPFLFLRTVPRPEPPRESQSTYLRPASKWLQNTWWLLAVAYLIVNGMIIIVPLIPPYTDGNGNSLQIKGWYYITIVACTFVSAGTYYLLAFKPGSVQPGTESHTGTKQPIISWAGVHLKIHEDNFNDPQYGNRRKVKVIVDDNVSLTIFCHLTSLTSPQKPSFLYVLFGGSDETHTRDFGVSSFFNAVFR